MASTDLFLFFKKLFMKQKQVVGILVSISFGSSQLEHTIKANCMKLQTVDPEIWTILIFDPGTNFSTTFRAWFFKKNISHVYSIDWPNFIVWLYLLLEISGNVFIVIVIQFVTFINFEIYLAFSSLQSVFLHDQKVKTKI